MISAPPDKIKASTLIGGMRARRVRRRFQSLARTATRPAGRSFDWSFCMVAEPSNLWFVSSQLIGECGAVHVQRLFSAWQGTPICRRSGCRFPDTSSRVDLRISGTVDGVAGWRRSASEFSAFAKAEGPPCRQSREDPHQRGSGTGYYVEAVTSMTALRDDEPCGCTGCAHCPSERRPAAAIEADAGCRDDLLGRLGSRGP